MNRDNAVQIIPFSPDLNEEIKNLNVEWLEKYFKVEARKEQLP